ncbi:site-specific recombinase [Methylotenera sp.]|uniref:site-specific recombinase n=1 Tax=Methylotenera sp. TaxID=2051956 RepID=UPI0027250188|nr:site-specific recombinase [Methylotenera sp.]MDO9205130.1 site-specific recombinase [Methylotenera sp.]
MIEQVFERYANDVHRSPQLTANFVANLIAEIRPPKPYQVEAAVKAIQALCYLLNNDPQKTRLLREAILKLLSEHNPISLFVVARHSAFSGFFTELRRRISHKFLPEAIDTSYLIDLFALFFTKSSDELWVLAVPDSVWEQLIIAIRFEDASTNVTEPCRQNLLEATQVLSYRIAALGLEPELLRNHPELEQHNSPFITQHTELAEFLASSGNKVCNATASPDVPASDFTGEDVADIKHILVMLDQCNNIISKIRRNSTQTGTSIQLTLLLQRMSQQISRLETLLNIIDHLNCGKTANVEVVQLFKALVYSECHKNDVHEHWQENMELMALRVTENASRTGEHYITENRSDYFALMRSAMGAGVIVGVMAMIKILFAKQHLAPLTEAILFSLNYGLGFILIHILHFTVATKQPAMTAAAIAASIDASDGKSRGMDNLVAMIACTMRSQMAAIFGNVVLAIPIAMLIAWGTYYFSGQHFVSPEKARHLLADIDPINSGALFYAAIAGVCLFLSGLIAGYHDNLAVYNKIPQRLRALNWLQKLLGVARLDRIANYIENNLGALAGNFYFGCLLGGMAAIGVLFGLPFDIRHITFSSAFVGFSMVGLDFMLSWQAVLFAALGLVLIGIVNLAVSFGLALYVAMKSRKVRFKQWRLLLGNLATRLNQHPGEFILPPQKSPIDNLTEK